MVKKYSKNKLQTNAELYLFKGGKYALRLESYWEKNHPNAL